MCGRSVGRGDVWKRATAVSTLLRLWKPCRIAAATMAGAFYQRAVDVEGRQGEAANAKGSGVSYMKYLSRRWA